MKKVKTQPRFKCEFCKRRSTQSVMAVHEKRCFRNPNRYCDYCENKGFVMEDMGVEGASAVKMNCIYCEKFDPKQLKEIQEREKLFTPQRTFSDGK